MSNKCPICNKAGLPNYKGIHVICPQCSTDLKPFLLLSDLSKVRSRTRAHYLASTLAITSILFGGLYLVNISKTNKAIKEHSAVVQLFQDSIKILHSKLNSLPKNEPVTPLIIIEYKVKNGDYPARIAEFFYNDWKMYKKIEQDNNLKQPYILSVGQTIYVKINSKKEY